MKKNISINISGIIFHIEEDGYSKFKKYLDSINKYFASYDDSEEIIADIESRIAELFLEKLNEGKQVISIDDVDALISTMGQISDFEAMEEEEDFSTASEPTSKKGEEKTKKENKQKQRSAHKNSSTSGRTLQRDTRKQILGGVASGLAHYWNMDPIWIRVFFIILLPTSLPIFVYFILWIALPGSDDLVEDDTVKKLYRDPDDRVLGGVASGLANYFKTDSLTIRIIFIVLIFGAGTGFLAYFVLWIITPKANSITDKMQMKGEKVTLSNIESTIKKSKEEELNPKGENTFTTILLFPFRLMGKVFSALGRAFGPLLQFIGAAIRVFTGGIITIVGLSVMFSLLVTAGVLLGLYNGDWFFYEDEFAYLPYDLFTNTFPEIGILFILTAIFIPFLYVFIAGITIIAKRRIMSSSVGWSILGIWMIAVIGTFATVPNVIRDFRDEGYYEETEALNIKADTLTIDINMVTNRGFESRRNRYDYRNDWDSEFTDLDLIASRDGNFSISKRFRARGRNPREAELNAQDVIYEYEVDGSSIKFDSELTFKPRAKFRFQELDINFYIPKNTPFKIERDMSLILHRFSYRYTWYEIYRNTWMFDDDGSLVCLSCDQNSRDSRSRTSSDDYSKTYTPGSFNSIEVFENMEVIISNAEDFEVRVEGPRSKVEDINLRVSGNELQIDEDNTDRDWSNVTVYIKCPPLRSINLQNGATLSYSVQQGEFLSLKTFDDSRANIDGSINKLELYIAEDSRVDITASMDKLKAEVIEGGRIYAYDARIQEADIETSAEARVRVNVIEYLEVSASGFSSVRYKGNPELEVRNEGSSASISKY